MAFTNLENKEINCKVLYLGAKGAGKTTNFESIYKYSDQKLFGDGDRSEPPPTKFFEFIPISLGYVQDFHVKLHLYTLPASNIYETVFTVLLKGIDGFVFVFDSRLSAMHENISHWNNMKELMSKEGVNMVTLPRVLQYNKRDHPEAVSLEVLRQELNRGRQEDIEASAIDSIGTMETVQMVAKQVLDKLSQV
ncbi:MAG: GTPase domain-containing protein [Pseudobacteriovorax sp.]|nr:GTPase domain-containing protein [Pseudobacteriovorax sp.]